MPKTTKKTTLKVQKLIRQAEKPLSLYLATSQIEPKTWSGIITTSRRQILARFNNHQVVRPLEAKAYLILRTVYWLIEKKLSQATLWTDNYNLWRRFTNLTSRPLEKGYFLEAEFRLTQRGKIPWPTYLWLARKLIAEHQLTLPLNYLKAEQNPAVFLTKSLKVCAKCNLLKKIVSPKRNCSICWKLARQKQYERWKAWQEQLEKEKND